MKFYGDKEQFVTKSLGVKRYSHKFAHAVWFLSSWNQALRTLSHF